MAKGLYANIHAKRKRIKKGSKERMRKPGTKAHPPLKHLKKQLRLQRKGNNHAKSRK